METGAVGHHVDIEVIPASLTHLQQQTMERTEAKSLLLSTQR